MRQILAVIWLLLGTAIAAAPGAARADGNSPARARPTDQQLEAMEAMLESVLPLHPRLIGYAGVGFAVAQGDGHASFLVGGAARADSNPVGPLWLTGKLRVGPGNDTFDVQGDLMAGFALSQTRKAGTFTWDTKVGSDQKYDYYVTKGFDAVLRETTLVAAGAKVFTAATNGGSKKVQTALALGMQFRTEAHEGAFRGSEFTVLWSPSSTFGGVWETWLRLPFHGVVGGGQIGLLPVDYGGGYSGRVLTIALELGISFGN